MANRQPQWLAWAREIQAISQTGETYAQNDFQRERYKRLREIAAEIVAEHSNLDFEKILMFYGDQRGYATPKVDVRGAVFQENKLLLVQERIDGGWTMPGGWADIGDLPSKAAEREVWEEAGYRVKATRVVGVYDANRIEPMNLFHAYKIVFLCDLIDGSGKTSIETSAVGYFGKNEIPMYLSGERTLPRHIQDAFNCMEQPELPVVFD